MDTQLKNAFEYNFAVLRVAQCLVKKSDSEKRHKEMDCSCAEDKMSLTPVINAHMFCGDTFPDAWQKSHEQSETCNWADVIYTIVDLSHSNICEIKENFFKLLQNIFAEGKNEEEEMKSEISNLLEALKTKLEKCN